MPAKAKSSKAAEEKLPEADFTPGGLFPLEFDEAAALSLQDSDDKYVDPDGHLLPAPLAAAVHSWQRPSEFLQALIEEGAMPCIVQTPVHYCFASNQIQPQRHLWMWAQKDNCNFVADGSDKSR